MSTIYAQIASTDENNNIILNNQKIMITTEDIVHVVSAKSTYETYPVSSVSTNDVQSVEVNAEELAETINKEVIVVTTPENSLSFPVTSTTGVIFRKGYSPYLSKETNTWWEYDDEKKQFIDTKTSPSLISKLQGSLSIGEYVFDGTEDVTIPVYDGTIDNSEIDMVNVDIEDTELYMINGGNDAIQMQRRKI